MATHTTTMEREIPTCDGCGKEGAYLCRDCQTPDNEVEDFNRNVRKPSHNDKNHGFKEW